jgi:hypothetical protein
MSQEFPVWLGRLVGLAATRYQLLATARLWSFLITPSGRYERRSRSNHLESTGNDFERVLNHYGEALNHFEGLRNDLEVVENDFERARND